MDIRISICTLATWTAWLAGGVILILVTFGAVPARVGFVGVVLTAAGLAIWLRGYMRTLAESQARSDLVRLAREVPRIPSQR